MGDQDIYPEHERMVVVQEQLDDLIEFCDEWLIGRGLALCRLVDSGRRTGFGAEIVMLYQPVFSARDLIHEFLEIDQKRIEVERRRMLDEIRASS